MWELDHKEGWALKNWCFWIVERRGEDFWESLVCKEIKTINTIGNQPWISTGSIDAEAEAPIFRPPDSNEELTPWKRSWCWGRLKAGGEDDKERDGWMALPTQQTWFEQSLGDGEGQGQALADGEGQGSLAHCSPCGCNELDTTEQLNKRILN